MSITVRRIAERAGVAILEVYNSPFTVEHKDDKSPVTEADRRAETLIIEALKNELGSPFPIIAEEEAAAGRLPDLSGGPFWLVDPLDGTKEFIGRRGEFTVNIALIEDGVPLLGVVHAPATGLTYWGSPHGAFMSEGGDNSADRLPSGAGKGADRGRQPQPSQSRRRTPSSPGTISPRRSRRAARSSSAWWRPGAPISIRAPGGRWNGTPPPATPSSFMPAARSPASTARP